MTQEKEPFKSWAIVELFGHSQLAGEVSEFTFAGDALVRIDVPATEKEEAFTKMYGAKAIYSMSPCSEAVARLMANRIEAKPITVYAPELLSKPDGDTLRAIKQHHPDVWAEASSGKLLAANNEELDF